MVKTLLLGMGLVVISTLLGSVGALLLKKASPNLTFKFQSFLQNTALYLGLASYGLSAFIFVYSLRFGDLSSLYPLAGLSYVWVALLSITFLGEHISRDQWLGIFLIFLAVVFIGIGG